MIDPSTLETASARGPAAPAVVMEDARPYFTLLDDGGGRFVVDPAFGVVSLRDEALLEFERGHIHHARVHVIEPSGIQYVLDMRLKITGIVPVLVRDMTEDEEQPL